MLDFGDFESGGTGREWSETEKKYLSALLERLEATTSLALSKQLLKVIVGVGSVADVEKLLASLIEVIRSDVKVINRKLETLHDEYVEERVRKDLGGGEQA